jgi:hypothetical protein
VYSGHAPIVTAANGSSPSLSAEITARLDWADASQPRRQALMSFFAHSFGSSVATHASNSGFGSSNGSSDMVTA